VKGAVDLQDRFKREINYLRVSVTDRCNLRCRYCMPADGVALSGCRDVLTLEEIARLVACAAGLGVNKVRLTGGEPLVRKGLVKLVERIREIAGIAEIALTTNGILLSGHAGELKAAGLDRVNISLDTMNPRKFRYITRRGDLDRVREGIGAALAAGLAPVKLNMVVMKGFNDDEVLDFARLTLERPLHVRFVELMPIGESDREGFLPLSLVRERIAGHFGLIPRKNVPGNGPAEYCAIPGAMGSIGFIAAMSHRFCNHCNRLRLTTDGKLRPCLQKEAEVDVMPLLRNGADDGALREAFRRAAAAKPGGHDMELNGWGCQPRKMFQIGG
jgi:cyclic pyranopterin phosphate synthase